MSFSLFIFSHSLILLSKYPVFNLILCLSLALSLSLFIYLSLFIPLSLSLSLSLYLSVKYFVEQKIWHKGRDQQIYGTAQIKSLV